MKLKILAKVLKVKSRFMKRKVPQADSNVTNDSDHSEPDVFKQVQEVSPQELEKQLLQDMVEDMNLLPMKETDDLGESVSHPKAATNATEKADVGIHVPGTVHPQLTGTTARTTGSDALTGTTLADTPPPVTKPDVPLEKESTPRPTATKTTKRRLRVKDFEPIALLGKGGFGSVFLVHDKVSQGHFALKVIDKRSIPHEFYPQIFEEQRIGRDLADSPWVVGVVGSFDDSKNFYILMEYSSGGDLQQHIRQHGTLDLSVVRRLFVDLVIGLEDLHQRRIMHRDIKLSNILIKKGGHAAYADFGLSKAFGVSPAERPWDFMPAWSAYQTNSEATASPPGDGRDLADDMLGTPGFTAPEVQAGAHYSYSSDIFSLGVVLFVLLFHHLPFGITNRMSSAEAARRVARVPLVIPQGPGPRLYNLLTGMLEKDPRRRITIAEIKAHSYLRSYDWERSAQCGPSDTLSKDLYRGVEPQLITKEPGICIPSGTPYKKGRTPFPWFEHAGAALMKPAPVNVTIPASGLGSPVEPPAVKHDTSPRSPAARLPLETTPPTRKSQKFGSLRAAVFQKMRNMGLKRGRGQVACG